MMIKRRDSEKGQALIFMVLGVVALLGFTALAIDGGMIYADRRFAQNGADAASVAGAGAAAGHLKLASESTDPAISTGVSGENWNCGSYSVQHAMDLAEAQAVVLAGQNSFIISPSADFSANGNIVATQCNQSGHYIDVRVSITMNTNTSLAHFVYSGPTENTVEAITRVFPREPIGAGYSIISLTDNCSGNQKGTRFSGTSDIYINAGGVFSNSCLVSDGSSGTVNISGGSASHDANFPYDPHGVPIINPAPQPVTFENKPTIEAPSCVGNLNPAPVTSGHNTTYDPGHYTQDISITGGGPVTPTVTLNPGLYCFDNGADISVNGGDLSGNGVTLFFRSDAGGFSTQGNGTVLLYPPVAPCTVPPFLGVDCFPAVPNLLIYMEAGNPNGVKLGGNSSSRYEGTVYAPTSQVEVGGNASSLSQVGVQVIGDSVRVHGTVTMTITYDSSKIYHTPNFINLEK